MAWISRHDLHRRSAYQPVIQEQVALFIAYVDHHARSAGNRQTDRIESNGTSIVDVTDPADPGYLAHVPSESGTQTVQTCRGADTNEEVSG